VKSRSGLTPLNSLVETDSAEYGQFSITADSAEYNQISYG